MISSVDSVTTPTQYVALRVQPDAAGWEGVTLRAYGTDSLNDREFETLRTIPEGSTCEVIKVGPFMKGATAAVSVSVLDADGDTVDAWTDSIVITNENSPAVIVRQAIYDIIEDGELDGVFLLTNGEGGPTSAVEDIPFVGSDRAVEVGAPYSRKSQKSPCRSEVTCEVPINIYIIAHRKGEAFAIADNTAWQVQKLVDGAPNLYLSGLGVNNFSWYWDVRTPDFVETEGTAVPVVVQEMVITVPVVWVAEPNK